MIHITIYGGFNGPGIVLGILHMLFFDPQKCLLSKFTDDDIETQKG